MVLEEGSGDTDGGSTTGEEEGKSGHFNTLPAFFSPPALLEGYVHCIGGRVGTMKLLYNKYIFGVESDTVQHSYCINEYTEDGVTVTKWARIGPTGYIWVELDELNLSYLFDFEVTEATIIDTAELEPGEESCSGGYNLIDLEIIYPKKDDPDSIKRRHILPNALVLKASKPGRFFNSDCTLTISYKYKMLSHSKATNCFWPDASNSMYELVSPPFKAERVTDSRFRVTNIRSGTVIIMAYIEDKHNRVQAAVASKMLLDVVTTRCRPVEISYAYKSAAIGYDLQPSSGFFTWRGGDKLLSSDFTHYRKATCGDHDCDPKNCIGPMWYPFHDCTSLDFYSWYTGAATCTSPIEGQPRTDLRYCTVEEYKAWVRPGTNWAASCGNGWFYSYSKSAGSVEFAGYGNVRCGSGLSSYADMGWTPPPFGIDGREITERWLTQEHCGFWDLSGDKPIPRSEYVPLVFDDEMLFTSFNAFEEKGRIGLVDDCLHTTCILNNMLSNVIEESISNTRYEFEDVFYIIKHGFCTYPPPVYVEAGGAAAYVIRYGFKDDKVAWVWREYWKDIERWGGDKSLNFVDFTRPNYYFDAEKVEHRLITDEGEKLILFTAAEGGDGSAEKYNPPRICISGGIPRQFKIIYDDYDSGQVDWVDEVSEGEGGDWLDEGKATGGWGIIPEDEDDDGTGDVSIYEKLMNNVDWFHDYNTIFDANASTNKSEDRKIVLTKDHILGDTYAWYNRGLIANIPKNRLIYLPYEEITTTSPDPTPPADASSEFFVAWYNDSLFSKEVTFYAIGVGCVTNIVMDGFIGHRDADFDFKGGIYCQPDLLVAECQQGDEECSIMSENLGTIVYKEVGKSGNLSSTIDSSESYGYDLDLVRLPERMLFPPKLIQVRFTLFPNQHFMLRRDCSGIIIKLCKSRYIDTKETIKVWEQRYTTSTGNFGDKNPNGSESKLLKSHDLSRKNAGQYFPSGNNTSVKNEISIRDKTCMVGAAEQYDEDESLDISMGNLKEIEKERQKGLYGDAYKRDDYDEMLYGLISHPIINSFMGNLGNLGSCTFKSEKLKFDDHVATISFDQSGDFWQPGGHYFKWGNYCEKIVCRLVGPLKTIYYPVAVHYKHGGVVIPFTPYEAYVGWSKVEYYTGRIDQAVFCEQAPEPGYTWTGSAGGFVMETFG